MASATLDQISEGRFIRASGIASDVPEHPG